MKQIFILLVFIMLSDNLISQNKIEILSQTNDVIACKGENIELLIDAIGTELSYRWFKDDIEIIDSSSSKLILRNIQYSNSGNYTCMISNNLGMQIWSKPIPVYVLIGTQILKQPKNYFWQKDSSATLSILTHANSDFENPIKIQWYIKLIHEEGAKDSTFFAKNGIDPNVEKIRHYDHLAMDTLIDTTHTTFLLWPLNDGAKYLGAKSQKLEIMNLDYEDQTLYYCKVFGSCSSVLSNRAFINEYSYFDVKKIGTDYFGCIGGDAHFKVDIKFNKNPRTLDYQWYKSNGVKLYEGDKFQGTNSTELTIKNVQRTDNNVYYLMVTDQENEITQQSPLFLADPFFPPEIVRQPTDFTINYRYNNDYNERTTTLTIIVENKDSMYFEWFRNDTLVFHRFASGKAEFIGPPSKTMVGTYKCRITNNCGTIWSKSVKVAYDYPPVRKCIGNSADLAVDSIKNQSDYIYKWYKGDSKDFISESSYYSGTNSNKLRISNINQLDSGYYHCLAINKTQNDSISIGKIYLQINELPKIIIDFPDTLKYDGKLATIRFLKIMTNADILMYQLLIDGKPYGSINNFFSPNVNNYFVVVEKIGGTKLPKREGVYQFKIWTDCGTIYSNKMHVIVDSTMIPKNIEDIDENNSESPQIINSIYDINSNIDEIVIYPNPATDYICIQPFEGLEPSESLDIQIFDMLGIPVSEIHPMTASHQMNIEHLAPGVYFLKIGNIIGRFVKM